MGGEEGMNNGTVLTLFDLPSPAPASDGIDWDGLAELALLYTATEKGNHSGIKFAATRKHAHAWCESSVSRVWTSCANFLRAYPPPLVLGRLVDNGEWDERIAAAGVTKIDLLELPGTLRPFGVECVGVPAVVRKPA